MSPAGPARPSAAALAEFAACVDAAGVRHAPDDLTSFTVDWRGRYHGVTPLVLRPAGVDQVQAIVRTAARHRVALVPQGGNTGLVGGGVPDASGQMVVLSLQRLNQIRHIAADDYSVTAEAGVVLADLHSATDAVDRLFPLSLGSEGSARLGGLIATNAGGVHVLRYGTMRALVLGLEAVLPDGTLFSDLGSLRKDNTGYDIKQLLIGSEGTLGVITAATLKLFPKPSTTVTALVGLADPARAVAVLSCLRAATGDQLSSFELIPEVGMALVRDQFPGTAAPMAQTWPCYALVEATSAAAGDSLRASMDAGLMAALASGDAADAVVAQSLAQAAGLWQLRERVPLAERQEGPAVKHDVSVRVADMPRFITQASATLARSHPGARVLAFGHLGDGNIHFNVRAPLGTEPADYVASQGDAITRLVHDLVIGFGGSISAEHGIGVLKRHDLARTANPAKLATMHAIKAALDPLGIFNPGRLL